MKKFRDNLKSNAFVAITYLIITFVFASTVDFWISTDLQGFVYTFLIILLLLCITNTLMGRKKVYA